MTEKKCCRCKAMKPASEFNRDAARRDGLSGMCKPCQCAATASYRQRNIDAVRARNREHHAKMRANFTEEDREKARAANRKYQQSHRPQLAIKNQRERARALGLEGDFTIEQWNDVLARYGHRCVACGATDVPLTIDHVVPVSEGGKNTPDNLQPLCRPCNARKGAQTVDFRKGEQIPEREGDDICLVCKWRKREKVYETGGYKPTCRACRGKYVKPEESFVWEEKYPGRPRCPECGVLPVETREGGRVRAVCFKCRLAKKERQKEEYRFDADPFH